MLFHGSSFYFEKFTIKNAFNSKYNGEFKPGMVWLTKDISTALTYAVEYLYVVEVPREKCGKLTTKKCYDFYRSSGSQNCYLAPQEFVIIKDKIKVVEYNKYPLYVKQLFKQQLLLVEKYKNNQTIYNEWIDCIIKGMSYEESIRLFLNK